jgi:uncharacterized membrane protein
MYFLDPAHGARRRARASNACTHLGHRTARAAGVTGRDVAHRLQGLLATFRNTIRKDAADDDVVTERVRSVLGHYVSHSHAIRVSASAGVVTLRGPILVQEVPSAMDAVRHVRGVSDVVDALERHNDGNSVPALQGGRTPAGKRFDILRSHWAPATRVAVGAAGAAIAFSSTSRSGIFGSVVGLVGLGLCARATTNTSFRQLVSGRGRESAIDVQKTIVIDAPVGEVYAFWSLYDRFPHFMSRVLEVKSSDARPMQSHWRVKGPAGAAVEFDAEVTSAIPNQLIAWRTLEGSSVSHTGSVRFDPEGPRRTRAHIRMSYVPPAGLVGHSVATVLRADPKSSMDADLVRMKSLIETGHLPRDAARSVISSRPLADAR